MIKREEIEGHFASDHIFETNENEFALAFGLIQYGVPLPEDFSEYGELRSYYRYWDDSLAIDGEDPFAFRPCTADDFSTDPEKPSKYFNTLNEHQHHFTSTNKLYCLDAPSI